MRELYRESGLEKASGDPVETNRNDFWLNRRLSEGFQGRRWPRVRLEGEVGDYLTLVDAEAALCVGLSLDLK
jgi:hypothetical protein